MVRISFVLSAALIAFPWPSVAQTDAEYLELCREIGTLAESIMTNRQNGTSIVQMMDIADGNGLAQSLVVAAYEEPRFSTPRYQAESISDFRDRAYLECFRAASN